ncbi:MAG TPA: PLP-dependent transferase [Propionibacteriaceae bacterium]|nr:PLP-dependent transferase [Propionibacteriaceae bacterium]
MTDPSSEYHSARHLETLAVTAGRPTRVSGAALNPAVHLASTYVGSHDRSTLGYGRDGNDTWQALEEAIGALEGGRAVSFASGLAACQAVLEFVHPGGVVVIPGECYSGVAAAVGARAARYGWSVRRVDVADTDAVLAAADGADLVWLESPTNPTLHVADLPRIGAELGGKVRLAVDNTFATPLLQRPLELGADIVVHSVTKMLSGHSDVLLGAVVTRLEDDATGSALADTRHDFGAIPGPMEAYLALRGLRTYPIRLARAQANAQILAERLARHPAVHRVRFPGLPSDPGHQRAARNMAGFGSLISIELADAQASDALVDACRLWVFATSLGGVESSFERRRRWPNELPTVPESLIRMSVGIEHIDDLWADLAQALDTLI